MPATNLLLIAIAATSIGLAGCDVDEGPVEETGEALDEAGDEVEDAVEEVCDEATDPDC